MLNARLIADTWWGKNTEISDYLVFPLCYQIHTHTHIEYALVVDIRTLQAKNCWMVNRFKMPCKSRIALWNY